MSFTLEIQFAGVCLYVQNSKKGRENELAVIMPDARLLPNPDDPDTPISRIHVDKQPAEPHVGYMRIDLAHLFPAGSQNIPHAKPSTAKDRDPVPPFEVVYRFGGQTMRFDLDKLNKPVTITGKILDVREFAKMLKPRRDLFTQPFNPTPDDPPIVLMRTVLESGELSALDNPKEIWSMDGRLHKEAPTSFGFSGDLKWSRLVNKDVLNISLVDLFGKNEQTLTLYPVVHNGKGLIRLKLANLCAENPLEWDELLTRSANLEDADFKWCYHLFVPPKNDWHRLLEGCYAPAPRLIKGPPDARSRPIDNCLSCKTSLAFDAIETWSTTVLKA